MVLTLSALFFGLLRGMGHALEPDHLAAVSTIVAENGARNAGGRGASRDGLLLGAAWGLGHTFTLLVVGGVLFLLRAQMPERIGVVLELVVAGMLVVLGVRALVLAYRERLPHEPRGHAHAHVHVLAHAHAHDPLAPSRRRAALARRPLLIGSIHGLAGSGALTAAVLAELPSPAVGVAYMLLFGLGSSVGMALLSGVFGVPLARLVKGSRFTPVLLGASGVLSVGLGLAWGTVHATELLGG